MRAVLIEILSQSEVVSWELAELSKYAEVRAKCRVRFIVNYFLF